MGRYTNMNNQTLKYINEHQLSSVMNNTKWRKLDSAVNESDDFVPHIRYKLIHEDEPNSGFTPVWWNELLEISEVIEWLEIQPFQIEHFGGLVSDKQTDFTSLLSGQLKKQSIPFSIENGMYRIWGYLRVGESPKFV